MIRICNSDAILVVDVQNDFINGSLAVPNGAEVVPVLNEYMEKIVKKIYSRDIHPADHASFIKQGGPWPPHCVAGTKGSEYHPDLKMEKNAIEVQKGKDINKDAYSAFDNIGLSNLMIPLGIDRLFIGGLATDYCVKATVLDALNSDVNAVYVLTDACRAVNVNPNDGEKALKEMENLGAILITIKDIT